MPHCGICLVEAPNHLDDCPVKTGRQVNPAENYAAKAHDRLMERLSNQQLQALKAGQYMGGFAHDPTSIELRIERLEKELASLAARVAQLEGSKVAHASGN
jgi:uncharacterized protein YceH (UPF0502 family)